jgi:hypothetical protein
VAPAAGDGGFGGFAVRVQIVNVGMGRTNPDLWGFAFRLDAALAPMSEPALAPDGTDRNYARNMADDEARWAAVMPTRCGGPA